MAEDRIAALRQRVRRVEGDTEPPPTATTTPTPTTAKSPKPTQRSERARHTLYLKKSLVQQLDQAFKAAAHDLYPQGIEKADYLEACLSFALEHQEEIRAQLATLPQ